MIVIEIVNLTPPVIVFLVCYWNYSSILCSVLFALKVPEEDETVQNESVACC